LEVDMTSCTYRGAEYHPSQKAGTQILGAGVYRGVNWKRRSMKPAANPERNLIWRGTTHTK
ncbi:MAG: DUF4278 domain-containing protein, partial [Pseudomonadota bacterium]|nr:DUF4278 domain-containing protein [Pseudomonadota bacterium]